MNLDGLPGQVKHLVEKYKLDPVVLQQIQTRDDRIKQRRERYGEFELSVAPLIVSEGKLLLIKKSTEAGGFWSIPGGFMEKGEEIEEAGVREAKEETGLDVELSRPLALFKSAIVAPKEGKLDYYLVLYQTTILRGDLGGTDRNEIAEVRFVGIDEMDDLVSSKQFEVAHPILDGDIIHQLKRILPTIMTPR